TVEVYKPNRNKLSDFIIEYKKGSSVAGLILSHNVDTILTDINVLNAGNVGIMPRFSYKTKIIRPKVEGSTTSTTGYGIQDNGSVSTIIHNGDFYRNRRAVDFSGTIPSRL